MPVCQNGWPATPTREGIVPLTVGGVSFPGGVLGGDVATVLRYVAEQWHARVEALVAGWCWGYAYREVRGGSALSNHAGGYALDLNAPRHPLGKAGTFSAAQVEAIDAIMREVGGVVRWGGRWKRPDAMHVEIVGTRAAVAVVASRIRSNGTPTTSVPPRPPAAGATLRRGSRGGEVLALQNTLKRRYPHDPIYRALVADGDYGPAVERAVLLHQRRAGLTPDGVAGPVTLRSLGLS